MIQWFLDIFTDICNHHHLEHFHLKKKPISLSCHLPSHPFPAPQFYAAAAAKSHQSCPTLCDPTDGGPPSSSVPGILQARILKWVAISFSINVFLDLRK